MRESSIRVTDPIGSRKFGIHATNATLSEKINGIDQPRTSFEFDRLNRAPDVLPIAADGCTGSVAAAPAGLIADGRPLQFSAPPESGQSHDKGPVSPIRFPFSRADAMSIVDAIRVE